MHQPSHHLHSLEKIRPMQEFLVIIHLAVAVAVEQTQSLANSVEINTGVAEKQEFDNPLYADSASLSNLYDHAEINGGGSTGT